MPSCASMKVVAKDQAAAIVVEIAAAHVVRATVVDVRRARVVALRGKVDARHARADATSVVPVHLVTDRHRA